ncbi:MAG: ABC transporter ATP-binding protein [bacterium]
MLILENITKIFGNAQVLRNLSIKVEDGEFVCIIGPSGCGKSTLLRIVAGLAEADAGTVHFSPPPGLHTAAVTDATSLRGKKISMVFQNGALLPWRTAEENMLLGFHSKDAALVAVGAGTGKPTPKKYLASVGLSAFADKYPHELSGGQRQRVGIARALAAKPSLLLLDEPFSALDPKTTHDLHDDVLRVWKEERLTVLMVSHSIEEAVSLADRIVLMKHGAVEGIFTIPLPYPRREQGLAFHTLVQKIRAKFFE